MNQQSTGAETSDDLDYYRLHEPVARAHSGPARKASSKTACSVILGISFAVLSLFAGCSQRDETVSVADDDPEMLAAIARARETLPQFWAVFEKHGRGESDFSLKVKITDSNGAEHFWTTDLERRDGRIIGTINNDPNIVSSVKLGDRIEIAESNISDWLYMRDGKMVGNETLKPLLKTMSPKEAKRIKSMIENAD